jgi:hypothetical protein
MHDAASPNFASSVCAWLDNRFTCRWIGRRSFLGGLGVEDKQNGLTEVPFLFHVLILLWGGDKTEVYRQELRKICELKQKIRNNFAAVRLEFLRKVLGLYLQGSTKWALKWCKNCSNIASLYDMTAI